MEHEISTPMGEPPILPPCDREVFERVWRRVMPEDRDGCPVRLEEAPAPAGEDAGEAEPQTGALAVRAPDPAPAAAPSGPSVLENDVPCLGAASAVYGALLQELIDREVGEWRFYAQLARRAPGNGARVLSGMAADERRHAKRLSAAYFLISGVRYWPADRPTTPCAGTYPAILRTRFWTEQKGEAAYRAAAGETADPALRELYLELAGDENAHAWLLRGLLEQM